MQAAALPPKKRLLHCCPNSPADTICRYTTVRGNLRQLLDKQNRYSYSSNLWYCDVGRLAAKQWAYGWCCDAGQIGASIGHASGFEVREDSQSPKEREATEWMKS